MYNPAFTMYRRKLLKDETQEVSKKRFKQEQWTLFCNRTNPRHGIDLCGI